MRGISYNLVMEINRFMRGDAVVAIWPHKPKVIGSIPIPATNLKGLKHLMMQRGRTYDTNCMAVRELQLSYCSPLDLS